MQKFLVDAVKHLRKLNTWNLEVDELQPLKITSGSPPVIQEQESKATVVFFQWMSWYTGVPVKVVGEYVCDSVPWQVSLLTIWRQTICALSIKYICYFWTFICIIYTVTLKQMPNLWSYFTYKSLSKARQISFNGNHEWQTWLQSQWHFTLGGTNSVMKTIFCIQDVIVFPEPPS